MFHKTYALALIAAFAFIAPVHAQSAQVNTQETEQNGAAVGTGNAVNQGVFQGSSQGQTNVGHPYSGNPQLQGSGQKATQNGAAVGTGNVVNQGIGQANIQTQTNQNYQRYHRGNPQLQGSGQKTPQNGAAVGVWNGVNQNTEQFNNQGQFGSH